MRLGLVGLGRIGAFHAATLRGLPQVSGLVVHDVDDDVVAAQAEHDGVEGARDLAELFGAGLDGLVIAAATDVHADLILAALDAGVPCFCEKPLARDPHDAVRVLRQSERTDVPVQIGYPRRFDVAFQAAREAVASGELGWVHTVRSTTLDPGPPPDSYISSSGGIFRDCSVHDFDAVRYVTGQDVVEVYATGSNQGAAVFGEVGDVDTAATVLTLESGALAVVSNSRYNARGHDVRLEVHGSQDSVGAGIDPGWPIRSTQPGVDFPSGQPHHFFMDRFADAFRRELVAFTEVVAGERESPCTVTDGLEASWIAEAATRSLAERRVVTLEEIRTPLLQSVGR
jgi:myo-inositol 2-dehydrogenase/D-chiro-inositol 1-dehydrogenase